MRMPECCDPTAPVVPCCICGGAVHTCEREEPDDVMEPADYGCPAHPDGCELFGGLGWVCSVTCWDVAARRMDPPSERVPFHECDAYDFTNQGRDCIGRGSAACEGCGGNTP